MTGRAARSVDDELAEVFTVDPNLCVRCGASSGVAPGLVRLGRHAAVVVRQPETAEERALLDQASALCPVGALGVRRC